MKKKITDLLDDIPVDLLDDIELGKEEGKKMCIRDRNMCMLGD